VSLKRNALYVPKYFRVATTRWAATATPSYMSTSSPPCRRLLLLCSRGVQGHNLSVLCGYMQRYNYSKRSHSQPCPRSPTHCHADNDAARRHPSFLSSRTTRYIPHLTRPATTSQIHKTSPNSCSKTQVARQAHIVVRVPREDGGVAPSCKATEATQAKAVYGQSVEEIRGCCEVEEKTQRDQWICRRDNGEEERGSP
jgi:hypothetical protein